jgi:hypothetical protein
MLRAIGFIFRSRILPPTGSLSIRSGIAVRARPQRQKKGNYLLESPLAQKSIIDLPGPCYH